MTTTLLTGNPAGPFVGSATYVDAGYPVTSASIKIQGQAILNDAAWMNADKLSKSAGGTVAGGVVFTGKFTDSGRRIRGGRVALSDAAHTVLVTDGNRFILPDPAAPRIITLKSTGTIPAANETFEFLAHAISTPGVQYSFVREDATVVATFNGSAITLVTPCWAEFEFSGGVWRLGANNGSAYDGTADYRVIPGAGA